MRATAFRFFLTPLIVAGTLAFFLLLMVGLGLIGVLWQNLLQRTREIGLRRAAGASRAAVHRQVLLEQLVLTSLGVLIGVPAGDPDPGPRPDRRPLTARSSRRVSLFAIATMYLISVALRPLPQHAGGAGAAGRGVALRIRYE